MGPAALASETINGKVYAIPLDVNPEGIYYSKDLFAWHRRDADHHP